MEQNPIQDEGLMVIAEALSDPAATLQTIGYDGDFVDGFP
jgi:hypothetical protein